MIKRPLWIYVIAVIVVLIVINYISWLSGRGLVSHEIKIK